MYAMSLEDRAYLAGLYEGEGYVGTYISKLDSSKRNLQLSISMTDKEPLLRVSITTGFLGLNGPKIRPPSTKEIWTWNVNTRYQVEDLYNAMRPYLSPRRIKQFHKAFDRYDYGEDYVAMVSS